MSHVPKAPRRRSWFKSPLVLTLVAVVAGGLIVVAIVLSSGSGGGDSGAAPDAPATTAAATGTTDAAAATTRPAAATTTPASAPPTTQAPAATTADTAGGTTPTSVAAGPGTASTGDACTPIDALYATGPFVAYGDLVRGLGDTIIGDRMVVTNFLDLTVPTEGGPAQGGFVLSLLGPGADDFAQYSGSLGPNALEGEVVYDPVSGELSGTAYVVFSTDPMGGGAGEVVEMTARYDPGGNSVTGSLDHPQEVLDFALESEPGVMYEDPDCYLE